ncbi:MAG: hypothetical protein M3256_13985 [Actinomycetota bacterium]|nr:hypothetical protein [Actinomycetota bacterium]
MSDLVPLTPRSGLPALPYRPGDRQQFLDRMLAQLVRTATADGQPFGLRTRAPDDPTVALLDAWATVADVVAFYQERIANEGFLRTATQPGSVLAIAQLVGYQPRPGLAASVWLAYSLHPDPTDTAVVLPAALLAQSVPGTGELPQTFETTEELVARPSWNTLKVRTTGPVIVPYEGIAALSSLAFQGTTTGLTANDVILLDTGGTDPAAVHVQAVTIDLATRVTTVNLQAPAGTTAAARGRSETGLNGAAGSHGTAGSDGGDDGEATPITKAIDALIPSLRRLPAAPPRSAAALNRGPAEVFHPDSDAIPRLVSALHPALASTLYKALATTPIGPATVTSAMALRVHATPFGARVPARPIFDSKARQVGTEEWPIGDVQTLSAQVPWGGNGPSGIAVVSVEGPGGRYAQTTGVAGLTTFRLEALGTVTVERTPPPPPPSPPTTPPIAVPGATATTPPVPPDLTVQFIPDGSPLVAVTIRLSPATDGSTTVTFDNQNSFNWVPAQRAAQHFTLGKQRVTIGWEPPAPGGQVILNVTIAVSLPLANPRVLDLDATYPGIVPGSWVVVDRAGPFPPAAPLQPPPSSLAARGAATPPAVPTPPTVPTPPAPPAPPVSPPIYPVVAQVLAVANTAVSRCGTSGTVTQLTLNCEWIAPGARWVSALRPLTVLAQPADLTLLPVALTDPLHGTTIALDALHAGITAGQRILVTGTRSDLPAGASVPAGEPAMVAGVTQTTAGANDTPHTTLQLATRLAYSYELASVQVFGNVVPAHQGSTLTEPLPGATAGDRHPSFTLSQAPVLADPSPTASGSVSSLRLRIAGREWTPVTRLDATTPPESYVTGLDSQGRTTITLSGPLPTGTSSVVATYRAGKGSAGNVRAHQVTQLLSRPLTVAGVDNPLPGSGGSDGDGPSDLRAGAPVGLLGLGRLVSVADVPDLVLSWAGVGKARAQATTDGHSAVVALTVAGVDPAPLDPAGALITALAGALVAAGGTSEPVVVLPASLYLIVVAATVRGDPAFEWTGVSAALHAALFEAFDYRQRHLAEDVVISQIVAVAHDVDGVVSFKVTGITLVPTTATASEIQKLTASLPAPPPSGIVELPPPTTGVGPVGASVAYLSGAMTETLILQQVARR